MYPSKVEIFQHVGAPAEEGMVHLELRAVTRVHGWGVDPDQPDPALDESGRCLGVEYGPVGREAAVCDATSGAQQQPLDAGQSHVVHVERERSSRRLADVEHEGVAEERLEWKGVGGGPTVVHVERCV